MENKTFKAASKYVDSIIELHGQNYKAIHKSILTNCINSNYSRNSNDFITYVWQILNTKFPS